MSGASPHPPNNPEVVANLWVYADEAGYVARVAGKVYGSSAGTCHAARGGEAYLLTIRWQ
jgi:hypothetical protein